MQPEQPHPAPVPPHGPPAASGSVNRRTGTFLGALILGLVLGGGGVGVAWALGDGGGTPSGDPGAAEDARAACRALDGFDESEYLVKGARGDIALNRYAAAGVLSASAAAGDAAYKPLAQAIRRSQDRHAQVFDFDAKVKKDLGEARRLCENL
ncbi:hypothetical protein ACFYT4_01870 [Streptomyces sp. NPDC004609]|uniref:hypothetical protein n=1 Tax=Streptomyces sp. NPDC004609 TaxID=3364704 RepID=UPI00367FDC5E